MTKNKENGQNRWGTQQETQKNYAETTPDLAPDYPQNNCQSTLVRPGNGKFHQVFLVSKIPRKSRSPDSMSRYRVFRPCKTKKSGTASSEIPEQIEIAMWFCTVQQQSRLDQTRCKTENGVFQLAERGSRSQTEPGGNPA